MSLFVCAKCGCVDNTATSSYWMLTNEYMVDKFDYAKELQPYKGMGLCSECGRLATSPDGRDVVVPGKWHGKFPEGINDMNGIIRYLDYYNSLYIDNVIFRETMDYDEQAMKNHDKMAYLKNNKVYLNDIWKCIDKDNRFTPIKQLLGYYYYVEVYKYQGIDMVSESANLVKLYEQKQIANDVVFEMIFHPNGNLNGSWVDNEDILLAYNSYKS